MPNFHARTRLSGAALRLMLSDRAAARFGRRIEAVLADVPHKITLLDALASATGESGVHIGFIARDVIADSGSGISVPLARFADVARRSSALSWVQTCAAGPDRPIAGELMARGVAVTTSSGATAPSIALTAFGGVIALARRLPLLAETGGRKSWEPLIGDRAPRDVRGQTAIVIGLGPIGQEITRLLNTLAIRVIGVHRTNTPVPGCATTIPYAEIDSVLPEADWLILACPRTDLTRRLIDARRLSLLPRGAHAVNVGRGGVIVDRDLIAALASGHIESAFLDVFEQEPLPTDSPFWILPNIIMTPHSASHSSAAYDNVGEIFLDNLA